MNIPPGYAQCNYLFTGLGAPRGAQVVMGVALNVDVDDPLAVAAEMYTAWEDNILPNQCTSITLAGVRCKFGPNATGADAVFAGAATGSNSDSEVTPQVALLARKNTALGGRANKGRMFIPGCGEDAVGPNGVVESGTITAYDGDFINYLADLAASATVDVPVLLHTSIELAPTVITSISMTGLAATQRRRLRKVGGRRRPL